MGSTLTRQAEANRKAQAREEAASKKEAAFKKSANDRVDKLALANNGEHAKDAAYLRKMLQNLKLDKARTEQIKNASDQQLLKFAESHRKNQKDAKKVHEQGRLTKMKESWDKMTDKMTPTSAVKGTGNAARDTAKGIQGGLNSASQKAPDVLAASIVVPNMLIAAVGAAAAPFVGGALVLLYLGYKSRHAINHAIAKHSSDTASLDSRPDVTEQSFNQAFGEAPPGLSIDVPDSPSPPTSSRTASAG